MAITITSVKRKDRNTVEPQGYPDATNRPHMLDSTTMAYVDAAGTSQNVTLKPKPAPDSRFGTNSGGTPNNGAFYDSRGWVNIDVDGTVVDGYDFDGLAVGNIIANNATISRCWFHNIDGQDSWGIWTHSNGTFSGLTVTDNLCHGTTGVGTAVLTGLLKVDGPISNVVVRRNNVFNAGTFMQFAPITGAGTLPYGNIVADNYAHVMVDGGAFNFHVEVINVSAGTGGLLISHNHFTGPTGQTANIYLCHDAGDVGKITIDDNLLDGLPQNTIYAGDTGQAPGVLIATAQNIQITNNKFADTGGQNPGTYQIDPSPGDSRVLTSGNVTYPSLTPISGM